MSQNTTSFQSTNPTQPRSTQPTQTTTLTSSLDTTTDAKTTSISPEIFDIMPALHELLNRTLPPVPGASEATGGSGQPDFPGQAALDISQLAGEVAGVRARIRKAKREVERLPDVERSVEEQAEEIEWLEERVRRQWGELEKLRGLGGE